MQRPPIPEYKPPKEFQDQLDEQKRSRTAVLPKRTWIQRNPRLFQISALVTSMLLFFSRPLYDAFFEESFELPKELEGVAPPPQKRQH